ncbi:hypothetical protein [Microbacterium thalassium]|uniref:Uncharacterized protein n=1 Tax=Microbacterium thalassium TaxID=362649 RepID=A0A7X0FSB5_9MICO|nr:hypothetical protein [Microbacterium thalassium]MBB6392781.1 hypothetical protein [Microbacterium thalassium]
MAIPPMGGFSGSVGGPSGYSYGAVALAGGADAVPEVEEALRAIRFTGWVVPPRDGWLIVLGTPGAGVVASRRRGIIEVGEELAARVAGPVFAFRVRQDRQLGIVAWSLGAEVGRFCSDPSREPDADTDILAEPVGIGAAGAFGQVAGRPEAIAPLTELLGERFQYPWSVFESERLRDVLRLLAMPDWLVAAAELPRDIPTGPRARELTRVRVGRPGARGLAADWFVRRVRRERTPPPVIADPPREWMASLDDIEPWML